MRNFKTFKKNIAALLLAGCLLATLLGAGLFAALGNFNGSDGNTVGQTDGAGETALGDIAESQALADVKTEWNVSNNTLNGNGNDYGSEHANMTGIKDTYVVKNGTTGTSLSVNATNEYAAASINYRVNFGADLITAIKNGHVAELSLGIFAKLYTGGGGGTDDNESYIEVTYDKKDPWTKSAKGDLVNDDAQNGRQLHNAQNDINGVTLITATENNLAIPTPNPLNKVIINDPLRAANNAAYNNNGTGNVNIKLTAWRYGSGGTAKVVLKDVRIFVTYKTGDIKMYSGANGSEPGYDTYPEDTGVNAAQIQKTAAQYVADMGVLKVGKSNEDNNAAGGYYFAGWKNATTGSGVGTNDNKGLWANPVSAADINGSTIEAVFKQINGSVKSDGTGALLPDGFTVANGYTSVYDATPRGPSVDISPAANGMTEFPVKRANSTVEMTFKAVTTYGSYYGEHGGVNNGKPVSAGEYPLKVTVYLNNMELNTVDKPNANKDIPVGEFNYKFIIAKKNLTVSLKTEAQYFAANFQKTYDGTDTFTRPSGLLENCANLLDFLNITGFAAAETGYHNSSVQDILWRFFEIREQPYFDSAEVKYVGGIGTEVRAGILNLTLYWSTRSGGGGGYFPSDDNNAYRPDNVAYWRNYNLVSGEIDPGTGELLPGKIANLKLPVYILPRQVEYVTSAMAALGQTSPLLVSKQYDGSRLIPGREADGTITPGNTANLAYYLENRAGSTDIATAGAIGGIPAGTKNFYVYFRATGTGSEVLAADGEATDYITLAVGDFDSAGAGSRFIPITLALDSYARNYVIGSNTVTNVNGISYNGGAGSVVINFAAARIDKRQLTIDRADTSSSVGGSDLKIEKTYDGTVNFGATAATDIWSGDSPITNLVTAAGDAKKNNFVYIEEVDDGLGNKTYEYRYRFVTVNSGTPLAEGDEIWEVLSVISSVYNYSNAGSAPNSASKLIVTFGLGGAKGANYEFVSGLTSTAYDYDAKINALEFSITARPEDGGDGILSQNGGKGVSREYIYNTSTGGGGLDAPAYSADVFPFSNSNDAAAIARYFKGVPTFSGADSAASVFDIAVGDYGYGDVAHNGQNYVKMTVTIKAGNTNFTLTGAPAGDVYFLPATITPKLLSLTKNNPAQGDFASTAGADKITKPADGSYLLPAKYAVSNAGELIGTVSGTSPTRGEYLTNLTAVSGSVSAAEWAHAVTEYSLLYTRLSLASPVQLDLTFANYRLNTSADVISNGAGADGASKYYLTYEGYITTSDVLFVVANVSANGAITGKPGDTLVTKTYDGTKAGVGAVETQLGQLFTLFAVSPEAYNLYMTANPLATPAQQIIALSGDPSRYNIAAAQVADFIRLKRDGIVTDPNSALFANENAGGTVCNVIIEYQLAAQGGSSTSFGGAVALNASYTFVATINRAVVHVTGVNINGKYGAGSKQFDNVGISTFGLSATGLAQREIDLGYSTGIPAALLGDFYLGSKFGANALSNLADETKAVGIYSFGFSGTANTNYTFAADCNLTFEVGMREILVTFNGGASVYAGGGGVGGTYDGTNHAGGAALNAFTVESEGANYSASIPAGYTLSISYTTSAGAAGEYSSSNAGTNTITVTAQVLLGGVADASFNVTTNALVFTISKAVISLSVINTADTLYEIPYVSRALGAKDADYTLTGAAALLAEANTALQNSAGATLYAYKTDLSGYADAIGAGYRWGWDIAANPGKTRLTALDNFFVDITAGSTVEIKARTLTVKPLLAASRRMTYGERLPDGAQMQPGDLPFDLTDAGGAADTSAAAVALKGLMTVKLESRNRAAAGVFGNANTGSDFYRLRIDWGGANLGNFAFTNLWRDMIDLTLAGVDFVGDGSLAYTLTIDAKKVQIVWVDGADLNSVYGDKKADDYNIDYTDPGNAVAGLNGIHNIKFLDENGVALDILNDAVNRLSLLLAVYANNNAAQINPADYLAATVFGAGAAENFPHWLQFVTSGGFDGGLGTNYEVISVPSPIRINVERRQIYVTAKTVQFYGQEIGDSVTEEAHYAYYVGGVYVNADGVIKSGGDLPLSYFIRRGVSTATLDAGTYSRDNRFGVTQAASGAGYNPNVIVIDEDVSGARSVVTLEIKRSTLKIDVTLEQSSIVYGTEPKFSVSYTVGNGTSDFKTAALVNGFKAKVVRVGALPAVGTASITFKLTAEIGNWQVNYTGATLNGAPLTSNAQDGTVSVTVTKKALTVSVSNTSPYKIYDGVAMTNVLTPGAGAAELGAVTFAGLVSGDTIAAADLKFERATGEDAGAYAISVSFVNATGVTESNYDVSLAAPVNFEIKKRPVTATATFEQFYGEAASTASYAAGGNPVYTENSDGTGATVFTNDTDAADAFEFAGGLLVFADSVLTGALPAGTYNQAAGGFRLKSAAVNINYAISANITLIVNQSELTLSNTLSATVVYGTSGDITSKLVATPLFTTGAGVSVSPKVTLTLDAQANTEGTSMSTAATLHLVEAADINNYFITSSGATTISLTVTKIALTATWTGADDGEYSETAGRTITVSFGALAYTAITPSITVNGTVNYPSLVVNATTGEVTAAITLAVADLNAGTYTLTVGLTSADANNDRDKYGNIAGESKIFVVRQKEIVLNDVFTVTNKTFEADITNPALPVPKPQSGFVTSTVALSIMEFGEVYLNGASVVTPSAAGTYKVIVTPIIKNSNYKTNAASWEKIFEITQSSIKPTADSVLDLITTSITTALTNKQTRVYDGTETIITASLAAKLTGLGYGVTWTSAAPLTDAGKYRVTFTASSPNYTLACNYNLTAEYEITKKQIALSGVSGGGAYPYTGNAVTSITATTAESNIDIVNTYYTVSGTKETLVSSAINPGDYVVKFKLGGSGAGNNNANVELVAAPGMPLSLAFSISKIKVAVTKKSGASNFVYGTAADLQLEVKAGDGKSFAFSSEVFVAGGTAPLVIDGKKVTVPTKDLPVGGYKQKVTVTFSDSEGKKYELDTASALEYDFSVKKLTVNLESAGNVTYGYSGYENAYAAKIAGISNLPKGNDGLQITYSTPDGKAPMEAGDYNVTVLPVVAGGARNPNIELNGANALGEVTYTVRITPRVVVAKIPVFTYDGDEKSIAETDGTGVVSKYLFKLAAKDQQWVSFDPETAQVTDIAYEDAERINAGVYYFTISISNPNLAFENGVITVVGGKTINTVRLSFTVEKARLNVALSIKDAGYTGKQVRASVTGAPRDADVEITYDGSLTAPKNAGNYSVLAIVGGANYHEVTLQGVLTINKGTLEIQIESREGNTVTVTEIEGAQYSLDGKTWQDSNVFEGVNAAENYNVQVRFPDASVSSNYAAMPTVAIAAEIQPFDWFYLIPAAALLMFILGVIFMFTNRPKDPLKKVKKATRKRALKKVKSKKAQDKARAKADKAAKKAGGKAQEPTIAATAAVQAAAATETNAEPEVEAAVEPEVEPAVEPETQPEVERAPEPEIEPTFEPGEEPASIPEPEPEAEPATEEPPVDEQKAEPQAEEQPSVEQSPTEEQTPEQEEQVPEQESKPAEEATQTEPPAEVASPQAPEAKPAKPKKPKQPVAEVPEAETSATEPVGEQPPAKPATPKKKPTPKKYNGGTRRL